MTFGGRFVLNLIHFTSRLGVAKETLLDICGCSEEQLFEEDFRVESVIYNQLVEKMVELSGDECIGLHAGESLNLSALGLVGQITQNCSDVKEAIERSCEFAMLGCRALPMMLKEEASHYRLDLTPEASWEAESPLSVRNTVDGTITFLLRQYSALGHSKFTPLGVWFSHSNRACISEYERLLGVRPEFGQSSNTVFLKKEHVEQKVLSSNYELLRLLVGHAMEKVDQIKGTEEFHDVVKSRIIELMKPEFPAIDQVAFGLNLSVRSLQRKLGEEGYSYKEIVESLKRDFAFRYMGQADLNISEIAMQLGYSNSAAFIKRFKKWTGQSPSAYRRANQGMGGGGR